MARNSVVWSCIAISLLAIALSVSLYGNSLPKSPDGTSKVYVENRKLVDQQIVEVGNLDHQALRAAVGQQDYYCGYGYQGVGVRSKFKQALASRVFMRLLHECESNPSIARQYWDENFRLPASPEEYQRELKKALAKVERNDTSSVVKTLEPHMALVLEITGGILVGRVEGVDGALERCNRHINFVTNILFPHGIDPSLPWINVLIDAARNDNSVEDTTLRSLHAYLVDEAGLAFETIEAAKWPARNMWFDPQPLRSLQDAEEGYLEFGHYYPKDSKLNDQLYNLPMGCDKYDASKSPFGNALNHLLKVLAKEAGS